MTEIQLAQPTSLVPQLCTPEEEGSSLITALYGAPTLMQACTSVCVLSELRSACRETRLLAQPEIRGILINIEQPLLASHLLQLPDVSKHFCLRRLHMIFRYRGQGKQTRVKQPHIIKSCP